MEGAVPALGNIICDTYKADSRHKDESFHE